MNTDDDMMDKLLKQLFEKNPYSEGAKEIKKRLSELADMQLDCRCTMRVLLKRAEKIE